MDVLWIGIDDSAGCVLQFHELREELRDAHGVELVGPGYSWPQDYPKWVKLSAILEAYGTPDWVVWDDSNALGYPRVVPDVRPSCKVAWRENDFHNRSRQCLAKKFQPDLILGSTFRLGRSKILDYWNETPGWRLVPFPVNTRRFHLSSSGKRPYTIGLYGKTGQCYKDRTAAKQALVGRTDVWLPTHGGYWKDGRGSIPGKTFYNDELAAELRKCKMLWVDGSDYHIFLQKYHEGIASGCLLVGVKPVGWDLYYPEGAMVECSPDDLVETIEYLKDQDGYREEIVHRAWKHCQEHHSIEARAKQIMGLLESELCGTSQ